MALFDKNILITPNKNASTGTDPVIQFIGADAATSSTINLRAYPTNNGTLSFEGSAGQLFSVVNTFTGVIFAVNDISGLSSISVTDTGTVTLAGPGNGFVAIASTVSSVSSLTGALTVAGGVGIQGDVYARNIYSNGSLLSAGGGGGGSGSAIQAVTNTNYFLTFVDSNNSTLQAETFYTTSTLQINPFSKFVGFNTVTTMLSSHRFNVFADAGNQGAVFGTANGLQNLVLFDMSGTVPNTSVNEQNIYFRHLGSYASATEGALLARIGYQDNAATLRTNIRFVKDNTASDPNPRIEFDYAGLQRYVFRQTQANFNSTLTSVSTQTGAFVVAGGVGIGQDLNVGGNFSVRGSFTVGTGTNTTFASTGDLTFYSPTSTRFTGTASSTSTVTGAVVVSGGVGIGGDLYVGGAILGSFEPLFVDDLTPQFDADKCVFELRQNGTVLNTATIFDSRDFQVFINGQRLEPYLDAKAFAFLPVYDAYRGFRVRENRIIIYNAPEPGSTESIVYQRQSTGRQTRRYPIPPVLIGLGD